MDCVKKCIELMDSEIKSSMEETGCEEEEALTNFYDRISIAFAKGEDGIDVLTYVTCFVLRNCIWVKELDIKVFHDTYHNPLFEEVEEGILGYSDGVCPQLNLPIDLAEDYLDYLYKKGLEDFDTFLFRCLCLGCYPNADYLRLSEEERKETFTADIKWVVFDRLLDMDEEDIDMAINLSEVEVTVEEVEEE